MNTLSSIQRPQIIYSLQDVTYDLLVIGGGITGAGIALDAASRGLKVALIEKDDFASGTSSKSTKLIHGGLRYLKQFEIQLVREVGQERAIVHKLAPHLVVAEKMLLPLVKGGTYGSFATSIGLWVYDILAGVKGEDRRRMLSMKATAKKEPLIRKDILQGGGFYAEYRTDDARLTIENIKTAVQQGAICLNYIKAEEFLYDKKGKVNGAICKDQLSEEQFEIKANYIISAAGPWVDKLRKKDDSLKGKHLFLSKGVHIVVPHERFPIQHSVYFDVPDGRMIYAIPRNRVTYIGTTDTPYDGDINNIPVYQEDADYLLKAVNQMFPDINLMKEDVESSWAGLRPLIHEEGKSASEMSRKDEIFESSTGLLSIAGGKLTGYRKMAERIVDMVAKKYKVASGQNLKRNQTHNIPLIGGPFANAKEVAQYTESIHQELIAKGLEDYHASYLVANYGKQSDAIIEKMNEYSSDPIHLALAKAELWFTVENELVIKPMDYFNRRTGRLYFDLPSIEKVLLPILKEFQNYFLWDDAKVLEEKEKVKQECNRHARFEYEYQNVLEND